MPAAEVEIDAALVRGLVDAQFPQWAGLPLAASAAVGWDNVIYRLGDELVVRLPRRRVAVALIENEQRWLPQLAPLLPVPVPVPVAVGEPSDEYPWPWTVSTWLPGEMAAVASIDDPRAVATALGDFVAALHTPAPDDSPQSLFRGMPLPARDPLLHEHLARVGGIDADAVRRVWDDAMAAAPWPGPEVWLHGDLHPANLLVHQGRLSGVIDFGDLCRGDPATDLLAGWMLFSTEDRDEFRRAARVDDDTWARGRGWALCLSVACVANSSDNAVIRAVGRRGVAAVLADGRSKS